MSEHSTVVAQVEGGWGPHRKVSVDCFATRRLFRCAVKKGEKLEGGL